MAGQHILQVFGATPWGAALQASVQQPSDSDVKTLGL